MAHQQESFLPFSSRQSLSCCLSHVAKRSTPKPRGPLYSPSEPCGPFPHFRTTWPSPFPPWLRLVGVRTSYIHFSNISWTPRVLDPITNPFLGPSSWLHPDSLPNCGEQDNTTQRSGISLKQPRLAFHTSAGPPQIFGIHFVLVSFLLRTLPCLFVTTEIRILLLFQASLYSLLAKLSMLGWKRKDPLWS